MTNLEGYAIILTKCALGFLVRLERHRQQACPHPAELSGDEARGNRRAIVMSAQRGQHHIQVHRRARSLLIQGTAEWGNIDARAVLPMSQEERRAKRRAGWRRHR